MQAGYACAVGRCTEEVQEGSVFDSGEKVLDFFLE